MSYPLIYKNSDYPEEPLCPICKKNKVFEPHNFVVIDGGALLLDRRDNSISHQRLEGFCSLIWHGHHDDNIEDDNKDTCVKLDIVKESPTGQFSLYFCSTECLRKFFNNLVDDLEREKVKATRPKNGP